MAKKYQLPELNYSYNSLSPHISEEQLRIHHQLHHKSYVDNANKTISEIEIARKEGVIDLKSKLKSLSFNLGGHILHTIFWSIMAPPKENNLPEGELLKAIEEEFGSFERFKKEFSEVALSVEGSGWAFIGYEKERESLLIGQIEKHNLFLYPNVEIIMAVDLWEHTYYLDYKNKRASFIENIWNIISWKEVERRFKKALD